MIEILNIEGMVVTANAMHCQKETSEIIIKNKGDYVLQLKANQKRFYKDVYTMFDKNIEMKPIKNVNMRYLVQQKRVMEE